VLEEQSAATQRQTVTEEGEIVREERVVEVTENLKETLGTYIYFLWA
jgi:hypothetical protein